MADSDEHRRKHGDPAYMPVSLTAASIDFPVTDERRANMLEATMSALMRDGVSQVTMGSIAQEAGVSRVTLYRAFKNRAFLLESAVAYRLMKFNSIFFGNIIAPASLSFLIEDYIVASINTAVQNQESHRWTRGGMSFLRAGSQVHIVAVTTWTPVVEAYRQTGRYPDHIPVDDLASWIMLLQYSFARLTVEAEMKESKIRERVRLFVAPAFSQ
ncbi:TetR/AcrR family transcriptional regulator [Sphingomonas sp.]|uniref:TetR/AcrR family transcriptional regulator n=1 Tax=Sphingomonas sp. TaxID=28214 RepID=UPI003CC605CE